MANKYRLNIDAIKSCLINTQKNFDQINAELTIKRKPPSDDVINNLLAGYQQIDIYLNNRVDLFAIGNSKLILELNHTVLFHSSHISFEEDKSQFKATQDHFYNNKEAGIGGMMDWLALHKSTNIWKTAAGLFTHILSQPQLFLEGNHRTGSLLMSYVLMQQGHSPFVLSSENARYFFEPAEMVKKRRKKTFDEILYLPKQTRKFAKLLKQEQNKDFFIR